MVALAWFRFTAGPHAPLETVALEMGAAADAAAQGLKPSQRRDGKITQASGQIVAQPGRPRQQSWTEQQLVVSPGPGSELLLERHQRLDATRLAHVKKVVASFARVLEQPGQQQVVGETGPVGFLVAGGAPVVSEGAMVEYHDRCDGNTIDPGDEHAAGVPEIARDDLKALERLFPLRRCHGEPVRHTAL